MPRYIVVLVGCLECGIASGIVGKFDSKEEAEKFAEKINGSEEFGTSQYDTYVFDLEQPPENLTDWERSYK